MSELECAPLPQLAWVPACAGITLRGGDRRAHTPTVIPLKSGTHASLRLCSGASEVQSAAMWVLGTSPRMTVRARTNPKGSRRAGGR
jgi:hypothetical protein